jgi:hypothetical protein
MASDTDTVVFVGPVDLADLTDRTKERFYQLVREIGTPGALLPEGDALLNGNPIWKLDGLAPRLEAAGYTISKPKAAKLRKARSISSSTIPVGADELAEALGITSKQLSARAEKGNLSQDRFRIGPKRAWDLNEAVADAEARGYPVNSAAAERWRARNGGGHAPSVNRVVALLRLDSAVTSIDTDSAMRNAQLLLENPEILNEALAGLGLRVLASTVETIEASPLG